MFPVLSHGFTHSHEGKGESCWAGTGAMLNYNPGYTSGVVAHKNTEKITSRLVYINMAAEVKDVAAKIMVKLKGTFLNPNVRICKSEFAILSAGGSHSF